MRCAVAEIGLRLDGFEALSGKCLPWLAFCRFAGIGAVFQACKVCCDARACAMARRQGVCIMALGLMVGEVVLPVLSSGGQGCVLRFGIRKDGKETSARDAFC